MTIFDVIATDNRKIYSSDSTSVPVTLTDTEATEYEIRGHVYRNEEQYDPQTGTRFREARTAIVFNGTEYPVEPDEGWTVEVVDNQGSTVTGDVVNVRRNQTLGLIKLYVETE